MCPLQITYIRPLDGNNEKNVSTRLSSVIKTQTVDNRYAYKYFSALAQGRLSSQARPFVRCSLGCESAVEVEPGESVENYPGS
jgi:hypothetical protein